ncbi:tetratricopeptide repeat protein [Burkholderia cepacia]|uniref:tetratricopeptide repeat protein n=1 Tax=Burkholderia cepacia TaxID=292 RepID=UPI000A48B792|nr:tetratricopeptide repeat protein [Burkholderia cepacia]
MLHKLFLKCKPLHNGEIMLTAKISIEDLTWLLDRGDLVGVNERLWEIQAWASTDHDVLLLWARVMALRGRYSEAQEAIARVLEKNSCDVKGLLEQARIAIRQGDIPKALEAFNLAGRHDLPNAPWAIEWIQTLIRAGEWMHVIKIGDAYCAASPANNRVWFWIGCARHILKDYIGALRAYKLCLNANFDDPMLKSNVGALYLCMGDSTSAKYWAEEAISEDSDNVLAWNNLAAAYLMEGQRQASECAIERAQAIDPNCVAALQAYEHICELFKRCEIGVAAIRPAIGITLNKSLYAPLLKAAQLTTAITREVGLVINIVMLQLDGEGCGCCHFYKSIE